MQASGRADIRTNCWQISAEELTPNTRVTPNHSVMVNRMIRALLGYENVYASSHGRSDDTWLLFQSLSIFVYNVDTLARYMHLYRRTVQQLR